MICFGEKLQMMFVKKYTNQRLKEKRVMASLGRRESRESPEGWMISRQRFEKLETNLGLLLPSLLLLLLLLLS